MIGPVAYVDPGAGSLLLQLVLGGIAGLAVILRLFWRRILSILGLEHRESVAPDQAQPDREFSADGSE